MSDFICNTLSWAGIDTDWCWENRVAKRIEVSGGSRGHKERNQLINIIGVD